MMGRTKDLLEEDWERDADLDEIYRIEREHQLWDELRKSEEATILVGKRKESRKLQRYGKIRVKRPRYIKNFQYNRKRMEADIRTASGYELSISSRLPF